MTAEDYRRQLALAQRHLGKSDPLMRKLVRVHGDCTLAPRWRQSPYEALVRAVIYQQLNGRVAVKILDRFVAALSADEKFPTAADILQATDEQLRSVGLSRQKISYLRAIAAAVDSGCIPTRRSALTQASDEAIIKRCTEVKGIGRWTTEMMLIFTLGRLDVLPVDDYGVRKGYSQAAGLAAMVTAKELRQIGAAWAPYRSVAAWYCWQAANAG